MLSRLGSKIHRFRRFLSRSEWAARHLRKRKCGGDEHAVHSPGVLIIQIDGLGYDRLLAAIDKKRLPFLQRLIQQEHFVLRKFYSGLPSATPAVQAELFFGVRTAVPAFKYFNREERREKVMFDAAAVEELAGELEKKHEGLLAGGSSYANIFAGGAEEARFCIQSMTLDSIFRDIKLRKLAWFFLGNLDKIGRIIGLSLLEAGLAVFDFFRGIFNRKNLYKEFKFVFSRIGACIVMRELVRLHVKIDLARGLPIIHANFIGYDEHSHRRNPSSAFALWTLKGIDATIKDLVNKAMRSNKRDYQIFIYSDHGQEDVVPYLIRTGRTLREAIREVFSLGVLKDCDYAEPESMIPHAKLQQRSKAFLRRGTKDESPGVQNKGGDSRIHITAMGPLGHIYLPFRPTPGEMMDYAERLVREAEIPLVFHVRDDTVICTTPSGSGELSEKALETFGADHPFLGEVTEDMLVLCRHRHAGDFVISGWRPEGETLSFPIENGSHGGPGTHETKGFVILPDIPQLAEAGYQAHLRPLDLRGQVRRILANRRPAPVPAVRKTDYGPEIIKVMTYNIHSCIGMDGKLFPARIARIINRYNPDIVALQEVDRNMERTGYQDQIAMIAEQLDMQSVFFPILKDGGGEYGLAVLGRFPFRVMRCIFLPQLTMANPLEQRGLIWVRFETRHGPVHLFNTHLGLLKRERLIQVQHIEKRLLDKIPVPEPVIFCADLNAGVNSAVYNLLTEKLRDARKIYPATQPEPTFFSSYPMFRLDHVFHSRHLAPISESVINDWECRLASDHLPVLSVFIYDPEIEPAG
ncbi:MAG: endonuclease/exonuclease/phosphatase family protein [Desulfurivibrionaceae bacterium]